MTEKRILVVDDDSNISEVVTRYLEREGYQADVAIDGSAALEKTAVFRPDLVVLDLMLPKIDGLEVCRILRNQGSVPIIMLTAKGEETDKLVGLNMGADDYLAKPFSPRELMARVKAVLRRSHLPLNREGSSLHFQDLDINLPTREVRVSGGSIELTAKEFDLLVYLAQHNNQVFSREQLLNSVWNYDSFGDASTVTVHIRRLREKIEADPTKPQHLLTVWGVGYKFKGEALVPIHDL